MNRAEFDKQKRYSDLYDYNFVYPENRAFVDGELRYPVNADEIKASIRRVLHERYLQNTGEKYLQSLCFIVGILMPLPLFYLLLFQSGEVSSQLLAMGFILAITSSFLLYYGFSGMPFVMRSLQYRTQFDALVDQHFEQLITRRNIKSGRVIHIHSFDDVNRITFSYGEPAKTLDKAKSEKSRIQQTTDAYTSPDFYPRGGDEVVFLHLDEDINGIL